MTFLHHPTEIIATLDAARQKYPSKEIVAIFQPHTFTRTIALLDEFAGALNQADAVYLAQIYGSAREVDHGDVKVEDLEAKLSNAQRLLQLRMFLLFLTMIMQSMSLWEQEIFKPMNTI